MLGRPWVLSLQEPVVQMNITRADYFQPRKQSPGLFVFCFPDDCTIGDPPCGGLILQASFYRQEIDTFTQHYSVRLLLSWDLKRGRCSLRHPKQHIQEFLTHFAWACVLGSYVYKLSLKKRLFSQYQRSCYILAFSHKTISNIVFLTHFIYLENAGLASSHRSSKRLTIINSSQFK